jgi:hypothetical protein
MASRAAELFRLYRGVPARRNNSLDRGRPATSVRTAALRASPNKLQYFN